MLAILRQPCSPERRAQLVMVGGLLLAILLIGLALVLNSAIYAENAATRGGVNSGDPVELRSGANVTAKTSIADINAQNADNGTYPELETELDARMDSWRGSIRKEYALSGRAMRLERTGVTRGWRIMQTNHERNLTAGGTDGMARQHTWRVASNVQRVGTFEQNLSRQSLYSAGYGTAEAALANSSYHIAIDEPGTSGFWRVYVFQGAGTQNVYVLTEEPDENFVGNTAAYVNFAAGSCQHQTIEWVELELRGGTFGGAPCDELSFFDNLAPGYDIYYNNTAGTDVDGNNVNRSKGSYELFVGQADVTGDPFYRGTDGRSPFRLTALYDADYEIGYESTEIDYASTVHAIPNRISAGNAAPTVSFSYTFDDSNDEYHVDWSVSDPDGDLSEVEILLYENATSIEEDSKTIPVSGSSADGVDVVAPGALEVGDQYDIYVIVTDENGSGTTEKATDEV